MGGNFRLRKKETESIIGSCVRLWARPDGGNYFFLLCWVRCFVACNFIREMVLSTHVCGTCGSVVTHVTTYGLVLSFVHNLFSNHGVWILASLILACFFSYCKVFIHFKFLSCRKTKTSASFPEWVFPTGSSPFSPCLRCLSWGSVLFKQSQEMLNRIAHTIGNAIRHVLVMFVSA